MRTPAEHELYKRAMLGMYAIVETLGAMPLDGLVKVQAETIAFLKVTDPAKFAKIGRQLEEDEIIAVELRRARNAIMERTAQLGRTGVACESTSTPSSPPETTTPPGKVM